MSPAMPTDVYRDERPGFRVTYRTGGQLLNHRRMHFQSCVSITTVHELLFADDCALSAVSEEDMQSSMDLFAYAYDNFGLVINKEKTVVMHQPPPDAAYFSPQLNVNGVQMQVVDYFIYLGSTLFRTTTIEDKVASRISKANQGFGRLKAQSGTATVSTSAPN
nr:unnamed protein product [Spirometra erinaceieuropaei]